MLTFRRYEYLCQIAASGNWMSVTAVMAAVRGRRIAVHQTISDLKRGGYVKRRKRENRIEVAITVAGIWAIRQFAQSVELLFTLQASRIEHSKAVSSPLHPLPAHLEIK